MEINPNNIEELILLYVDGELSTEEAGGLLQYLALHPQWRTLLEEYKSLVIPQDEELVFEGKEALLQPEPRALPFKPARKLMLMRSAAAIALIAGAAGLTWMFSRQDAGSALPATATIALAHQPAVADTPVQNQPAPVAPSPVMVAAVKPAPKAGLSPAAVPDANPGVKHEAGPIDQIAGNLPVAVGTLPAKQQALEMRRPEALTEAGQQEAVAATNTLPGWLPVSDQKLEGLNGLLAHIRNVKDSVASKAAQLRKTTFVIRLGEKEIAFRK